MWWIVLYILNLWDMVATLHAIEHLGAYEVNPFMRWSMEQGHFIPLKSLVFLACIGVLWGNEDKLGYWPQILVVIYSLLAGYHVFILF